MCTSREYLGQFLRKITVPNEFMLDPDIEQCYEEYENKITEFKNVHKKLVELSKHKGISELVNDLKQVEEEVDCCSRKLDTWKCNANIQGIANDEDHLQLAKELRLARTEKNRLSSQAYIEERKLWTGDKKSYILSNKLHEIQELNSHSSPEGVLERSEQDCEIMKFIVHRKIPQDIEVAERKILALQTALSLDPEFPTDLEATKLRVHETRKEIQRLEDAIQSQENDASLTFARQKANQNKKKKLQLFDELEEMRKDMIEHQNALRERRERRKELFPEGIPCLTTRDFKEYVKTIRVKAAKYKAMREELSQVQSEISVMANTKRLAEEEFNDSVEKLKELEEQFGLVGFSYVYEKHGKLSEQMEMQDDEGRMRYIYEMTEKAREMQEKVKAKKADLDPLSKETIELKQTLKTLDLQKKALSTTFEVEIGPITEKTNRMEANVTKLNEEIVKSQEEMSRLLAEIPILKASMQHATAEAEVTKGSSNSNNAVPFKNRLLTRIVDQERLQKSLKQEMSELEQNQTSAAIQLEMWSNLKRLLEEKVIHLKEGSDPY